MPVTFHSSLRPTYKQNENIMKRHLTFSFLPIWVYLASHCASAQELTSIAPIESIVSTDATGEPVALSGDTTRLKFGSVRLIIIDDSKEEENEDSTYKEIPDIEVDDKKFNNWAGMYFGVNGFLSFDNKLALESDYRNFELDYSKSITFGMNFGDLNINLIPNHVGLSTGMGIQWNRYAWKNNTDLVANADTLYAVVNTTADYSKNILKATYLQIPLLLDINTNKCEDKSFHISAGIIGGYKLGSKIKQKYEMEDKKFENRSKGHYQLSPFQAYLTAQIGYGGGVLFVNYGLTRVFEKDKGPQLYPFTAGFKFLF